MLGRKIVDFKKINKVAVDYFSIEVIPFLQFIKKIFLKIKIQFFCQNIQNTEKVLINQIVF